MREGEEKEKWEKGVKGIFNVELLAKKKGNIKKETKGEKKRGNIEEAYVFFLNLGRRSF